MNEKISRNPVEAIDQISLLGYKGLLVVGDVHGNLDGLLKAINHANQNKLFMVFLGDVCDYGAYTLETTQRVAELVFANEALCIRGNHEKKVAKILLDLRDKGSTASRISHGNDVTLDALQELSDGNRTEWERMFFRFVDACPDWQEIGNYLFVHGAASLSMFGDETFRAKKNSHKESFAQYGETTGEFVDGYPIRVYGWTNREVPDGKTVVVGHDIRSTEAPLVIENAEGGEVIFLDTGSSKGGILSWMDLQFGPNEDFTGVELYGRRFMNENDL